MNKAEFLANLQRGRADWESMLSQIDAGLLTQPGVDGDYSVKDVIAHVTWYEREALGIVRSRSLVGSPHWDLPTQDERNTAVYEEIRNLPAAQVLAESGTVYQQLYAALQTLTDDDLVDAAHFREMPPDWAPWEVLASNCYEHYAQHLPNLLAWLTQISR